MQVDINKAVEGVVVTESASMTITAPTDTLNAETRQIAEATKTAVTGAIDSNGTCTTGKTLYLEKMLGEGLDEAAVRRFTGHHRNAMAGIALGAGEAAFQFMQDHPDVNVVRVDVPTIGKDHYSVKVTKQRDVAGNTHYGLVNISHELHGGGKDDQLTQVKSVLGNKAREIWAKL